MKNILKLMFDQVFGSGMFSGVTEVLKLNPSDLGIWSEVELIYETNIVPLAVGILFIYFIVNFIHTAASERNSWENLFMQCAKMLAGKYLIDHGMELMAKLYGFGISFVNNFTIGSETLYNQDVIWELLTGCEKYNTFKGLDTLELIGCILLILIPFILSFIIKLGIMLLCYTRILQLMLKTVLAPIAFADFFVEGLHGKGWSFIKGYFGTCLQGGVIALTLKLFMIIQAILLPANMTIVSFFGFSLKYLAIMFAALTTVFTTSNIIKEVI